MLGYGDQIILAHECLPTLFACCISIPWAKLRIFQGAGKRRWSIEDTLTSSEQEEKRSVQDIDLRVLADFKETQASFDPPF